MNKKELVLGMEVKDFQDLIKASIHEEFENFNPRQEKQDLITSSEACEFLRISKVTMHKWINERKIQPYYLGSKLYFKRSELEQAVVSKSRIR